MRWLSAQGTRLTQPQGRPVVDLASPLARGLVSLLWAGGEKPCDLLKPAEAYTVVSAPAGATAKGLAAVVTAQGVNGVYTARGGGPKPANALLSFFFVGEIGSHTASNGVCGQLGGSGNGYRLGVQYGTRGRRVQVYAGGSAKQVDSGTWSTGQGVFGLVADGTNLIGYDNGRSFGSTACSGAITYDASFGRYQMFGSSDQAGSTGAGLYLAVWNRALTPSEVASLSANPWQLFEPERRIWVPVSASGGGSSTSLVIQSALHAHAADGPTLTTDSTLAVSDALHAHSADALTLGTDLLLAVDDASHAHAAEALTLDIGTALLVADATHAHAADGLALTTDSFLAVADALHGHTAENLALTADGAVDLVIQDALHAHTADELTLSATGAGGYYDDPKRAPRKREKLTVIHPDTSEQREFEALLQRVKGQALDKAKSAAQAAPAAAPSEIKPPRMPEIRGVEASLLRQWMPDLLSTYRATFTAELQALASAQQAAAQAQMRALQRQQYDDEEIALLAMLA